MCSQGIKKALTCQGSAGGQPTVASTRSARRPPRHLPRTSGAAVPHLAHAPDWMPTTFTAYPARRTSTLPHFGHSVSASSGPILPV